MKTVLCLAVLPLAAARADTLFFTVSNTVSPEQPSATVTAWAGFDPQYYAFTHASFEFHAEEPGLSEPHRLLKGPGTFDGWLSPNADEVTGIRVGQLHFPSAGIFADTTNPIELWSVTWTTDQFHPREVDLWSALPSRWNLYIDDAGSSRSFLDSVSVEHGSIMVVPAPWAWPAIAGVVFGRRRRLA